MQSCRRLFGGKSVTGMPRGDVIEDVAFAPTRTHEGVAFQPWPLDRGTAPDRILDGRASRSPIRSRPMTSSHARPGGGARLPRVHVRTVAQDGKSIGASPSCARTTAPSTIGLPSRGRSPTRRHRDRERATVQRDKEALERQTATANVLKRSALTFDLGSVLETLIGTAARLCRASLGVIFKVDGDVCRPAGLFGAAPALIEHLAAHPPLLSDGVSLTSRAVAAGRAVQVVDAQNDPDFARKDVHKSGGFRRCWPFRSCVRASRSACDAWPDFGRPTTTRKSSSSRRLPIRRRSRSRTWPFNETRRRSSGRPRRPKC